MTFYEVLFNYRVNFISISVIFYISSIIIIRLHDDVEIFSTLTQTTQKEKEKKARSNLLICGYFLFLN